MDPKSHDSRAYALAREPHEKQFNCKGKDVVTLGTQRGSGDRDGRPELPTLTHL